MTVAACMHSTRNIIHTVVLDSMTLTSALTCSIEMSSELNGMSILVPVAGTVSTYLIGTTAAAESCMCRQTEQLQQNRASVSRLLLNRLASSVREHTVCAVQACVLHRIVYSGIVCTGHVCSLSSSTITQLRKSPVTVSHCSTHILTKNAASFKSV
jgi:hypothetical protein